MVTVTDDEFHARLQRVDTVRDAEAFLRDVVGLSRKTAYGFVRSVMDRHAEERASTRDMNDLAELALRRARLLRPN